MTKDKKQTVVPVLARQSTAQSIYSVENNEIDNMQYIDLCFDHNEISEFLRDQHMI